jgi:hypothetical protein
MLRVGGVNNIAPQVKEKFLLLSNIDASHREGAWHYIFEFDARESLQKSPLAMMMQPVNGNGSHQFSDKANWAEWLGEGWQIIDEHVRNEILKLKPVEPSDGIITGVRELPNWYPGSRQIAVAAMAH